MSLEVDLFFSLRSPYSYFAVPRLRDLVRDYDVDLQVRSVLPLAVRDASFFERINPLWPPYVFRDTTRLAEYLGMGFRWPRPDPIVQNLQTGEVAKEQPYIHRLTRLSVCANERGRGLPFIYEVSQIIWNGEVDGWHEGDHLAGAVERAGLNLAELDEALLTRQTAYDGIIQENQKALERAAVPFYNLPKIHRLLMKQTSYSDTAHITRGYASGLLQELGQDEK